MKIALAEAKKAYDIGEVPVGAVIVKDDKVIAKAHNMRETKKMATAHAEILVIEKACKKTDTWRLDGCDLYVTVEPCPMCAGAILNTRINNVYIGAMEPRSGATGSKINLFEDYNFNHKVSYETGILEDESRELVQAFFKNLRENKQKIKLPIDMILYNQYTNYRKVFLRDWNMGIIERSDTDVPCPYRPFVTFEKGQRDKKGKGHS